MAGFPKITAEDAVAIRSASKKLKFNPIKLMKLEKAKKRGATDQQAFAQLLDVPADTNIRQYLAGLLTQEEFDTFQRILGRFPGDDSDAAAQAAEQPAADSTENPTS